MGEQFKKQYKDLTEEDKKLYEWIECTSFEESARGESWVIRGLYIGEEVTTFVSQIESAKNALDKIDEKIYLAQAKEGLRK